MYKVQLTNKAQSDLQEITTYIAQNLRNSQAAHDFLDAAASLFDDLSQTPNKYSRVQEPYFHAQSICWASLKNYLAFYRVHDSEQQVNILLILYQKRNWQQVLKDDSAVQ